MILTPQDFHVMEQAMRHLAKGPRGEDDDLHREAVGRVVLKLYSAGMTDPERLAEAAGTLGAMRHLVRRR